MPYFLDGTIAGLPEPRKPGRPGFFQRTFRRGQPSFCTPSVHLFGWLDHRMPYSFGPIGPEALSVLEKAGLLGVSRTALKAVFQAACLTARCSSSTSLGVLYPRAEWSRF